MTDKGYSRYKERECVRCGHVWVNRIASKPRICPKCKSAYWDLPRRATVSKDK